MKRKNLLSLKSIRLVKRHIPTPVIELETPTPVREVKHSNPFRNNKTIPFIKPLLPDTEFLMSLYQETRIIKGMRILDDKVILEIPPPQLLNLKSKIINVGANIFMVYGNIRKIKDFPINLLSRAHLLALLSILDFHMGNPNPNDSNINAFSIGENGQWLVSDNVMEISKVLFEEQRLIISGVKKKTRGKLNLLVNLCLRMNVSREENLIFTKEVYSQIQNRLGLKQ